ncbi:hypothetical protein BV25DRAFT_1825858, partial [Artomyces pyxidatus]
MSGLTNTLDHIVHLTPPGTVQLVSEQFRSLGFNVIPGGTHADGLTANALVILPDSTYLELICFTHPASHYPPGSPAHLARTAHQWANKDPGWTAYACLGAPTAEPPLSAVINERAAREGLSLQYAAEVAGGRTRGDGVSLKWEIAAPVRWAEKEGGTRLPFFCGDVTPRSLRVPTEPRENTIHKNAAQSIAHLRVLAAHEAFSEVSKELESVVGEPPVVLSPSEHAWVFAVPSSDAVWHPRLILREPDANDEAEAKFIETHGAGLFEVGVRVERGEKAKVDTPYGR